MNLLSVRERILDAIATSFRGMTEGDDDYTTTWSLVTRTQKPSPLTSTVLAIHAGPERKVDRYGYNDCVLEVRLMFYYPFAVGDVPDTELNRIMADIQRWCRRDIQWGGLAVNTQEIANSVEVESPSDKVGAGIVVINVLYRHTINDPRRMIGE